MMTKILTRRVVTHVIESVDDKVSFEVDHPPATHIKALVRPLPDGGWVVGYLSHDDDSESPLESADCQGKIYTRRRHDSRQSHAGFQEALGLDSYWHRDRHIKPNPLAVLLDCYDHGGVVWAVSGSEASQQFPDQRWDVSHCGGVWVPDDGALENIHIQVMRSYLPDAVQVGYHSQEPYGKDGQGYLNRILVRIKIGDTLKSVQTWRSKQRRSILPDEINLRPQGYRSFRSAMQAACRFLGLKPDRHEYQQRLRATAVAYANGVIEEYNCWLRGDCWGVCVETFDAELQQTSSDACWNMLGEDYAKRELRSEVEAHLAPQEGTT